MSANVDADGGGTNVSVFITPMLDMTFQMLAFFIMVYHPSAMEGQMDMAMPSVEEKAARSPQDVSPESKPEMDPLVEVKPEMTVMVRTQRDGANDGLISSLTVQDRSGQQVIDNLEALRAYLEKAKETLDGSQPIKLQADARLKWSGVLQVMDVCRQAGFPNVSFAAPPDLGAGG